MEYVNSKIKGSKAGTPLHGAQLVEDPSENIIKVYLQALEWEMQQRKFNMTAIELSKLQGMSIDLLDGLKELFQTRADRSMAGNLKKHIVSFIRFKTLSCLVGQKISALRDQSIATLTFARK